MFVQNSDVVNINTCQARMEASQLINCIVTEKQLGFEVIKLFFMHNSAVYEIYPAH